MSLTTSDGELGRFVATNFSFQASNISTPEPILTGDSPLATRSSDSHIPSFQPVT